MKQLRNAIDRGHVVLDLDASDITSAIEETVRHMVPFTAVIPSPIRLPDRRGTQALCTSSCHKPTTT